MFNKYPSTIKTTLKLTRKEREITSSRSLGDLRGRVEVAIGGLGSRAGELARSLAKFAAGRPATARVITPGRMKDSTLLAGRK